MTPPFVPRALPNADRWVRYGGVLPGTAPLHATNNAQAVTFTGPRSSRWFYGLATWAAEPAELVDPVFMLTMAAFQENLVMIQAQLRTIAMNKPGTARFSEGRGRA